MAASNSVYKLVILTPEQAARVKEIAKDNPRYTHNSRPSESAVVRDALDAFFLAEQSDKLNRKSEQPNPAA